MTAFRLITTTLLLATLSAAPALRAAQPEAAATRDARLVETYRNMLREDPDQPYALRRLLEVSHVVGGVQGLIDLYTKEVEATPKSYASWMVLGHLHRAAEHVDDATKAYGKAAGLKPKEPGPHVATAELHRRVRGLDDALAAYDKAIALLRDRTRQQEILKAAAETAIEAKQLPRAEGYFERLIKTEPRNLFLRMEHAATLVRLGEDERALVLWQDIGKRAKGQLKYLVLVWKEVAQLQQRLDRFDEAEATWREALKRTPTGHWARAGFIDGLIGLHRRQDKLRALIQELETKGGRGHETLVTLARLYEEVADDDKALELFGRAVKAKPSDTRSRMRAIKLLERIGKPEQVINAYKALIRSSPGEPRHELRLAELYFHQARKREGFDVLARMSRRYTDDPGVHQSVIDLTMRYGDRKQRARIEAEYKTLMRLEPKEESHVISLGEYYWTEGNRSKALSTWKRLLQMGRTKAEGFFLLAEVYADHDMTREAADAYEEALSREPANARFAKAYALLLEKQKKFGRALDQWRRIVDGPDARGANVRDARRNIIKLWEKNGRLDHELQRLEERFKASPPDVEAGRFLATAYLRMRRTDEARRVLERLRKLRPSDVETLVGLETVYTRSNEIGKAIDVLEALAQANSRQASEYLHRAADLALSRGDDKKALAYMRQVVELNPADPLAHARVGELYRRMGSLAEAAEAWRQSLVLDPRNRQVQFRLASLYRDMGNALREEQVLGDIVREARDPSDALRAGRRLLRVASVTGRLIETEEILRPLVFSRLHKGVYLKLLVDLYALECHVYAFASDLSAAEREDKLRAVGERGLKPLLDALGDDDVALRARALDVLRLARPAGAAPALARLAHQADQLVQFQAAVALGRVGSASAASALAKLATSGVRDNRPAAVWALGLIRSDEAGKVLQELLFSGDQNIKRMAALALGRRGERRAVAALDRLVSAERREAVKSAGLWALGRIASPAAIHTLEAVVLSPNPREVRLAAWGLSRLGTDVAKRALARALWRPKGKAPAVVAAALVAAGEPVDDGPLTAAYQALVDYGRGRIDSNDETAGLFAVSRPPEVPADGAAARLERLRPHLDARLGELVTSRDRDGLAALLGGMIAGPDGLALAPIAAPDPKDAALTAAVLELLAPHLASVVEHGRGELGPEVQAAALEVLARVAHAAPAKLAAATVEELAIGALEGSHPGVRLAGAEALARVARPGDQASTAAVLAAVRHPELREAWLLRRALARALGRLGGDDAALALGDLLRDGYAVVRRAAVDAAAALGEHEALTATLIDLIDDPVPDVAVAVAAALGRSRDPRAREALEALVGHSDPRLGAAARRALAAGAKGPDGAP